MVDEMVASFVGGWESERMDSGQKDGCENEWVCGLVDNTYIDSNLSA